MNDIGIKLMKNLIEIIESITNYEHCTDKEKLEIIKDTLKGYNVILLKAKD